MTQEELEAWCSTATYIADYHRVKPAANYLFWLGSEAPDQEPTEQLGFDLAGKTYWIDRHGAKYILKPGT